jgi:hypothetical protein
MGVLLLVIASRTALGPNQLPIQWVPGANSPGIKRPRREAQHSPPSSVELGMTRIIPPLPQHVFTAWSLVKYWIPPNGVTLRYAQGQIYLTFTLYIKLNVHLPWWISQNGSDTFLFILGGKIF